MGCSASRVVTVILRNSEDSSSSSSSSSSKYSSASASHSSNSSSRPIRKALCLRTPLVHHPPIRKGDTHHLVSLTSTTYGSLLLLDQPNLKNPNSNRHDCRVDSHTKKSMNPTDLEHSLSPDSVINIWELMDGLEDFDFESYKLRSSVSHRPAGISNKPICCRYTAFDGYAKELLDSFDSINSSEKIVTSWPEKKNPFWQHLSEESLLANLDPNVAWTDRRALSSRQLGSKLSKNDRSMESSPLSSTPHFQNKTQQKIVVYLTSLRGIRETYEDCCSVIMILKGFRVAFDERDISMDSSYRKELQKELGGKHVSLPQVFIGGKHVGGADEIKQLNEVGELAKLLEGFPVKDPCFVCGSCGGVRFLPCPNCSGRRKVFEEEEERDLKRCPDCNENGLMRCPGCCSS